MSTSKIIIKTGNRYWIPEMPTRHIVVERVTPTRVYYAMQKENGYLFRDADSFMGRHTFAGMVQAGRYLLTSSGQPVSAGPELLRK